LRDDSTKCKTFVRSHMYLEDFSSIIVSRIFFFSPLPCPTIAAVYEKCLRKAVSPQREWPRHVYRHHRHRCRRRRRRRRRLTWRNLDSTREHNFNYRSWPHCLRTQPTARQESSRGLALSSRLKFSGRGTPFGRATHAEEHKGDFSRAARY